MVWVYVGVAVGLGLVASWWLRSRHYRRDDDTLYRSLSVWWVPGVVAVGAVAAGPFFAHREPVVVLTFVVALVWGVVLAGIDLEVRRLPDALVLPAYPVAAALLVACSAVTHDGAALLRAVTCAGAAVLVFLLAALVSPSAEGLGLGDVKLAGVLGGLLGWISWTTAVLGLLSGFVLGGVGAVILILARRVDRRSSMSFGPAMILAAYLWCVLTIAS